MNNFLGIRRDKDLIKTHSSMNNFIGIRIGQRVSTGEEAYLTVLNDGNTKAWYLADQLSTITKNGSNRVSRWNDYLGSGRDLLMATAVKQPLWVSPGTVRFDGTNYAIKAIFAWNQPAFVYLIFKQITWTNTDRVFDGNADYSMNLVQNTGTPRLTASAGASLNNDNLPINTWGIARILFNGANSRFQIDDTAAATGNLGAGNPGGFTLGSLGSTGSLFSNIEVKEAILRNINYVAADDDVLYNYLVTRKP